MDLVANIIIGGILLFCIVVLYWEKSGKSMTLYESMLYGIMN